MRSAVKINTTALTWTQLHVVGFAVGVVMNFLPALAHSQNLDSQRAEIPSSLKSIPTEKAVQLKVNSALKDSKNSPKVQNEIPFQTNTQIKQLQEQIRQKLKQNARTGGDISGGGTSVLTPYGRRLLDVYSFPDLSGPGVHESHLASEKLIRLYINRSAISNLVADAIKRVGTTSLTLSSTLEKLSKNFPLYLVQGHFQILHPSFEIPVDLENQFEGQLSTTALYVRDIGVLISRQEFIEMSSFHQTALIIHELIRMLQIQFEVPLTHAELQTVVAAIFTPDADLTRVLEQTGLKSFIPNHTVHPLIVKARQIEAQLVAQYGSELSVGLNQRPAHQLIDLIKISDLISELSLKTFKYRVTKISSGTMARSLRDNVEVVLDSIANQLRADALGQVISAAYGPISGLVKTMNHAPAEKNITACFNRSFFISEDCQQVQQLFDTLIR